jgi:signal transduction histidine kinase
MEQVHGAIGDLIAATEHANTDVRAAILELRTDIGPQMDLLACLRDYAVRFQREWRIETTLTASPALPRFDAITEVQLLRIIQEAMTNVRKYSSARRAWIRFQPEPDCTLVEVEDDGIGFDPLAVSGAHFGLSTMRERAEQVHAAFQVESRPGNGTRVRIRIPLPPDAKEPA